MKVVIKKNDISIEIEVSVEEIVKLVSVLDDNVDREDNEIVEQYDLTQIDDGSIVVETYRGYFIWGSSATKWYRWFRSDNWEDRSPLLDDIEQAKRSIDLYLVNK